MPFEKNCYKSDSCHLNSTGIIQCRENTSIPQSQNVNNLELSGSHSCTCMHPMDLLRAWSVAWLLQNISTLMGTAAVLLSGRRWDTGAAMDGKHLWATSTVQPRLEKVHRVLSWSFSLIKEGNLKNSGEVRKFTADILRQFRQKATQTQHA